MYDKKPIKGQVMGKSLGYGFVEFIAHEQALQALRHLNNNPDIFGPQKVEHHNFLLSFKYQQKAWFVLLGALEEKRPVCCSIKSKCS